MEPEPDDLSALGRSETMISLWSVRGRVETEYIGSPTDIVAAVVEETTDEVAVTAPHAPTLVAVVEALSDASPSNSARVVTTERTVQTVTDEFVTASRLADLAVGTLSVRVVDHERLTETALLTPDEVVAVLTELPTEALGVATAADAAVDDFRTRFESLWESALETSSEATPYSELVGSLREELDATVCDDFERAVDTSGVRGSNGNLDVVDLLVLLSARHGQELYELTQWGSAVGVASVGTFSQSKRRLEDIGIVETESVRSGDVGRPRQRLLVGHERLRGASVEELVAAAQSVLVD